MKQYLENGVKVFFGGLCIVLWQLISEIRADVKLLLKSDAEKTLKIEYLEKALRGEGQPTRPSSSSTRQFGILPSETSLRKKA